MSLGSELQGVGHLKMLFSISLGYKRRSARENLEITNRHRDSTCVNSPYVACSAMLRTCFDLSFDLYCFGIAMISRICNGKNRV